MHDVGYLKGREGHARNGSILAREYLNGKLPQEDIEIVCQAIANHGGKKESDYVEPISMCLILADKFDFAKNRYKEIGTDSAYLPAFLTVESVKLERIEGGNFALNVYTSNLSLFKDINDNYFFIKLYEVLRKLEKVCGYSVKIDFVEEKEKTL